MKWTDEQITFLRERYADETTPVLAAALGRNVAAVQRYARNELGLRKSEELMRRVRAFAPGAAWRGGRVTGEPLGTIRIANGLAYRKVDEDAATHLERWRPVHELVWIEAHGPVPEGHVVVFKPGCKTVEPERITPERVECITRAALMQRNSRHRLPIGLVRAITLRAILVHRIKKRTEQLK